MPPLRRRTIADVSQTIDVVELTSVSSAVRREEATIDDGRDDRQRAGFEVVTAADVGTPRTEWHVDALPASASSTCTA